MNYFRLFRALLGALVWLSLSQVSMAQQATLGVPALKVVAPNGQESILLGDLHVGVPGLRQPSASVFDKAQVFVTEHPYGVSKKVEPKVGTREAPWAQVLTDAERRTYFARAQCLPWVSREKAEEALTYESVQTANQIAYTVCVRGGVAPSSRETVLSRDKPLLIRRGYLEAADWVENQRGYAPPEASTVAFRWILQRDPQEVLSGVVEALNAGDYERIEAQLRTSMGGAKTTDKHFDVMITQRNKHWMPGLRKFLDDGRAVILVGAAHLPGPNGLIELLRAGGYTVTPIKLPAASRK